jgi:hypothetical protein
MVPDEISVDLDTTYKVRNNENMLITDERTWLDSVFITLIAE